MNEQNKNQVNELPYSLRGRRQLEAGETFNFDCRPGLSCFTRCCADVNIFLTPTDVLRLSRHLKITSTEFLDNYTLLPITKELHLPTLLLRMLDEPQKRCPFVKETGCSVYENRPWSCRMFPLAMALPPARAGVEPKPVYFLFEEDFCEGKSQKQSWTVEQWKANQGVDAWEQLAQKVSSLSLTDPRARDFRRQVFGGAFDAVPDKQGRVNLPPYLRRYANIDSQAMITGLFDHCEIWNPESWRERQERGYSDPEGRAAQFESLGI